MPVYPFSNPAAGSSLMTSTAAMSSPTGYDGNGAGLAPAIQTIWSI
jgi:hypothetical protein